MLDLNTLFILTMIPASALFLISMVVGPRSKSYIHGAQSMAIYNLKQIKKMATPSVGNVSSKAHKAHLVALIDNALKEIK